MTTKHSQTIVLIVLRSASTFGFLLSHALILVMSRPSPHWE